MAEPTRVLMVCLGNICRSPLAEAILREQARARGLAARIEVDSAGTGGHHAGERADPRSQEVARRHGLELTGTARAVRAEDFRTFDRILAMDAQNERGLLARRPQGARAEVGRIREYDPQGPGDVPDPYYGGVSGFEDVYAMLERSCACFLDSLHAPDPGRNLSR